MYDNTNQAIMKRKQQLLRDYLVMQKKSFKTFYRYNYFCAFEIIF